MKKELPRAQDLEGFPSETLEFNLPDYVKRKGVTVGRCFSGTILRSVNTSKVVFEI